MLIYAADLNPDASPRADAGATGWTPRLEVGSAPVGAPWHEDGPATPRHEDGALTERDGPGGPATPRLEGPATPRLEGPATPRDAAPKDEVGRQRSSDGGAEQISLDFPDDGGKWRWAQDLVEDNENDEVPLIVPKAAREAMVQAQKKAAEARLKAIASKPVWKKSQQAGKLYSPRTGHAVVLVGDTFYLMGGTSENGVATTVYTFSNSTCEWAILPVGGQAPCPRSGAKAAAMGRALVLFGGYSKRSGTYFNDLHVLDLKTSYWIKVNVSDAPPPRVDHTLVSFGSELFVFGGFKEKQRFKDLQRFSFRDNLWTEVNLGRVAPPGRVGHTAVIFAGSMFMFGGWSGRDTLDDLYELRCGDRIIREIRHAGSRPYKRYRHSAVVYGKSMFIFGGTSKLQERYDDLWEFNIEREMWSEVAVAGARPSARTFHCAAVLSGQMFVFGGYDGERKNDLHVLALPGSEPCETQVATPGSTRFPAALAEESNGGATPHDFQKLAADQATPEAARAPQRQQALRIMDVDEVPGAVPSLKGLFGLPVAPLLDSTASLFHVLGGLQGTVVDALQFARNRVSTQGPDPYGLTEDMIAGINVYTSEVLHSAVNQCLRSGNDFVVKSFFPFLRLLLAALERLPDYSGQVYCGARKDLSNSYPMGSQLSIWSFQSAMTDADALADDTFLGKSGTRSLLCIRVTGGKDISAYSANVQEKEILIPAGCTFTVEDVVSNSSGEDCLKLFRMRQTRASDLLAARPAAARPSGLHAGEPSARPRKCCSVQ
mmetsp:Transcript_63025/g.176278  ORF Transcript_63025/g.176278 Transcript_63025/m.176278 type:complete len:772 (+) Transcript_63025:110-2425(+)